jgi:hypothetical protein
MGFRGVGARRKIGNGNARFFNTEAGAGAKPVLLLRGSGLSCDERSKNKEKKQAAA